MNIIEIILILLGMLIIGAILFRDKKHRINNGSRYYKIPPGPRE